MDDKNILELHVERQDTDGTAKRAAEYHKRLIHQTSHCFREGIPGVSSGAFGEGQWVL